VNAIYMLMLSGVLFSLSATAQMTSNNRRAQQAFDKAGSQLRAQQYHLATALLEEAVALDSGFAAAYQQLGDIHRKQGNYEAAARNYKQVVQLAPTLTPLTWFGLGESLLHTGNYADALTAFNRYLETPGLAAESKRLTDKYIADCAFG